MGEGFHVSANFVADLAMDLDDLLDDIDIPEDEETSSSSDVKKNVPKGGEKAELDEVDMDSELKSQMEEQVPFFFSIYCSV